MATHLAENAATPLAQRVKLESVAKSRLTPIVDHSPPSLSTVRVVEADVGKGSTFTVWLLLISQNQSVTPYTSDPERD